jgi:hypothetical protein
MSILSVVEEFDEFPSGSVKCEALEDAENLHDIFVKTVIFYFAS